MANSIPTYTKIPIPFANSGDKNSIPQNATGSNLASYSEGFPPITSQPITENGIPPERGDFNGLGFSTTNNISYLQQGGLYTFDAQLSSAIGGYAQGAILAYINNGQLYYLRSKINNNTYNFNTNSSYIGQYWEYAFGQGNTGGFSIGSIFAYPSALPPAGAFLLNGQTIPNCQQTYKDFWNWLTSQIGEYETVPIYKAWTQTPLTEDGTMGGSDYACSTDGTIVSGRNVWESFNMTAGNNETICVLNNTKSGSITFYSPVPLRINSVTFTRTTAANAKNIVVEYIISGSNDNSTWTELASGDFTDLTASATLDIPIDSSNYSTNYSYKYYKFYGVNNGGTTTDFPKIYLYGEEFVRTIQESNGYIRAINAEGYEAEIAEYGMCGAFVISGSDVRLPKWNGYQTPLGNSVPVKGNGMALGLTNGVKYAGLATMNTYNQWTALSPYGYKYGLTVGDTSDGSPADKVFALNQSVGVTEDSTKSGIIADTSGYAKDGFYWCIQVFNAATDLSNQESAQLASQMQMKAQKDLGNVDNNIDFVVDSWNDEQGNWYRVYRSGWCEQGGRFSIASTKTTTITLLKPYLTNKYSVQCQSIFPGAFANMNEDSSINIQSEPTNSTIIFESTYGAKTGIWEAKGYIA